MSQKRSMESTSALCLSLLFSVIDCWAQSCDDPSCLINGDTFVIGNSTAKGTIRIGYLMDLDQMSATNSPYRIGAISMAIADGQANGLLRGYNFRFVITIGLIVISYNARRLTYSHKSSYLIFDDSDMGYSYSHGRF